MTIPIIRFKQLIEQLQELHSTRTEPQNNNVDLAINTEKSILDETLIWKNSSNRVEDHLDIAIYDKATTAGVERTVSLDNHLSDDSKKSIMFPWSTCQDLSTLVTHSWNKSNLRIARTLIKNLN